MTESCVNNEKAVSVANAGDNLEKGRKENGDKKEPTTMWKDRPKYLVRPPPEHFPYGPEFPDYFPYDHLPYTTRETDPSDYYPYKDGRYRRRKDEFILPPLPGPPFICECCTHAPCVYDRHFGGAVDLVHSFNIHTPKMEVKEALFCYYYNKLKGTCYYGTRKQKSEINGVHYKERLPYCVKAELEEKFNGREFQIMDRNPWRVWTKEKGVVQSFPNEIACQECLCNPCLYERFYDESRAMRQNLSHDKGKTNHEARHELHNYYHKKIHGKSIEAGEHCVDKLPYCVMAEIEMFRNLQFRVLSRNPWKCWFGEGY